MNKLFLNSETLWVWDLNSDSENLAMLDLETQKFLGSNPSSEAVAEFVSKNKLSYGIICNVWVLMAYDSGFSELAQTIINMINNKGLTACIAVMSEWADQMRHNEFTSFTIKWTPGMIPVLSFPKRFSPWGNTKLQGTAISSFRKLQDELREFDECVLPNHFNLLNTLGILQDADNIEYKLVDTKKFVDIYSRRTEQMSHGSCWFYNTTEDPTHLGVPRKNATSRSKMLKLGYIRLVGDKRNVVAKTDIVDYDFYDVRYISSCRVPISLLADTVRTAVVVTGSTDMSSIMAPLPYSTDMLDVPPVMAEHETTRIGYYNRTFIPKLVFEGSSRLIRRRRLLQNKLIDELRCSYKSSVSELLIDPSCVIMQRIRIKTQKVQSIDCVYGTEVPKTASKRRFICISNPKSMSDQLRGKIALESSIRESFSHEILGLKYSAETRFLMPSRRQFINQAMAKFGAQTGLYATYDFSAASDQITLTREKLLLRRLYELLRKLAPSHIMFSNVRKLKTFMTSFSPMGVGFTFENLKIFVFVLGECAIQLACRFEPDMVAKYVKNLKLPSDDVLPLTERTAENCQALETIVSGCFATAMGDDACIPAFACDYFEGLCEILGISINHGKTFRDGDGQHRFRESCGKDFLYRYGTLYDVTPIYWPRRTLDTSDLTANTEEYDVQSGEWTASTTLSTIVKLQQKIAGYCAFPDTNAWLTHTIRTLAPDMTFSVIGEESSDLWGQVEIGPVSYLICTDAGNRLEPERSVHPDDVITCSIDNCEIQVNKRIGHYTVCGVSRDYNVPKDLSKFVLPIAEYENYVAMANHDNGLVIAAHSPFNPVYHRLSLSGRLLSDQRVFIDREVPITIFDITNCNEVTYKLTF